MQNAEPFARLIRHMRLMGRMVAVLCVAWVAVVGLSLLVEIPPSEMHNFRSPEVKERIARCAGEYAERYDCSETILLRGGRIDVTALAARMVVTAILPAIAWSMWTMSWRRTLQMCAVVAARLAWEKRRQEELNWPPRFPPPALPA